MRPIPAPLVPAVVIGLGINGMGTVRSLARRGIGSIAISAGRGEPSERTRYGTKVVLRDFNNANALVDCLLSIGARLPGKSIVFPSGDIALAVVSEHRSELETFYHFPMPAADTVDLILNKSRFYRFAQDRGLPVARTFFPRDAAEAGQVAGQLSYPALIKPSIATPEWRHAGLKILPVNNALELMEHFVPAQRIHRDLIVQEVTPGPDSALYFSLTYLDSTGVPHGMFTGRKIRQYVPHYGISSMAESLWVPEIDRLTREVLSALRYTGYGSVEFKRHAVTGEYLMTEVTGRTWYPHALSELCGINLPYAAYCDLVLQRPVEPPATFEDHVKWIDEVGDAKSAFLHWRAGELSLAELLKSYRGKRFWALAARDDPGPFFALLRHTTWRLATAPLRLANGLRRRLFAQRS